MIPRVDDVASDPLTHNHHDLFNPPGLTNFHGCVQVDRDLTGTMALSAPPVGSGIASTGQLSIDGIYLPVTGVPVTFRWRPDRVERTTEYGGLRLRSTTVMSETGAGVIVRLEIANRGTAHRDVDVRLTVSSEVCAQREAWLSVWPPDDPGTTEVVDRNRQAVIFTSPSTGAADLQGLHGGDVTVTPNRLESRVHVPAGGRVHLSFVRALGTSVAHAQRAYDALAADPVAVIQDAERRWNRELAAIFDPDDDTYSGSMPILETGDVALRRLYWMGILGVVYFRRDSEASVLGRTYDTLMPRHWQTVTFLWDYSLSAGVHALLDPEPMKRQIEHWLAADVHTCMGTEWLTGKGLGAWYSVNDFAIIRCIQDRLRWSGETDWLDREVGPADKRSTLRDAIVRHATAWKSFDRGNGLADYGDINNLLECVSSYVGEVAALNAANVWCMRLAAEVVRRDGREDEANLLNAEAAILQEKVLERFSDTGWWKTVSGDREVEVRHVYDFITTIFALGPELGEQRGLTMLKTFMTELETATWMRALSGYDPDATFSTRPDHQWNGAFNAWPSEAALARFQIGDTEDASEWLRGLARSANQGPFGQAHYADGVVPQESGGALKAVAELPAICDWACSGGGSWATLIIDGVFGVKASLDGVTATPRLDHLDPDARLVGLRHHGRTYTVDRDGVTETG